MQRQKIFTFLLVALYSMTSTLYATEYDKTSYYVAYDSGDTKQYVLVLPSVQKAYTHEAGHIAPADLKAVDDQFVSFPTYSDGTLCFSALKNGVTGNNGASVMAGKCYEVKFFYTQKEVVNNGVAFILFFAPSDKVYEGLAGDSGSFKVVREGDIVHNENSITGDDYTNFAFNVETGAVEGVGDVDENIDNSIVGSWYTGDATQTDNIVSITFFENGSYTFLQDGVVPDADCSADDCHDGMERGTYGWNTNTGVLSTQTLTDTNGEWGLSHVSSPLNISIVNNTLTMTEGTDVYTLNRVENISNSIVGSWYMGDASEVNNIVNLTFFSNGTYVMLQDGDSSNAGDPSGQDGMERGTYSIGANGILSAQTLTDTNGEWGLSNLSESIVVDVNNNTLTMTEGADVYTANRIVAEGEASTSTLTTLLAGKTLYTTSYDEMGTMERWVFNTDLSSATWAEMIGGTATGSGSLTIDDMTMIYTCTSNSDAECEASPTTIEVKQILTDYLVLEVSGGELGSEIETLRLYFNEEKARAYLLNNTIDFRALLAGKTLYKAASSGGEARVLVVSETGDNGVFTGPDGYMDHPSIRYNNSKSEITLTNTDSGEDDTGTPHTFKIIVKDYGFMIGEDSWYYDENMANTN